MEEDLWNRGQELAYSLARMNQYLYQLLRFMGVGRTAFILLMISIRDKRIMILGIGVITACLSAKTVQCGCLTFLILLHTG